MNIFYVVYSKKLKLFLDNNEEFTQQKITPQVKVFDNVSDINEVIYLKIKSEPDLELSIDIIVDNSYGIDETLSSFVIFSKKLKFYMNIDSEFTEKNINDNVYIFDTYEEAEAFVKDHKFNNVEIKEWK